MQMRFTQPERQVPDSRPAPGPHLLGISSLWAPGDDVRRLLMARHERLRALDWRHTVIAPGAVGPGMIDCGGVRLPGRAGQRLAVGRGRAIRQIAFAAPDIIEAADPGALGWAALAAAERLKVPAVAFCHADLPRVVARLLGSPASGGASERWTRRYLVSLYRHFDAVMTPRRELAERLKAWGVPRVTVQPTGVDCSVFTPCALDNAWRSDFCKTHGLAPDTRLLTCTQPLVPPGGLQRLADAVALLGRGHALVAVGGSGTPPVGDHVLRLPSLPDDHALARLIASSDAYLHDGEEPSSSLGVLQAMACGTRVVASAAGSLAELVDGAGMLVPLPRVGSWADAIDACLKASGAQERRAALARAQAHDWSRVLAQMTRRYSALIGSAAAPMPSSHHAPMPRRPWPQQLAHQR